MNHAALRHGVRGRLGKGPSSRSVFDHPIIAEISRRGAAVNRSDLSRPRSALPEKFGSPWPPYRARNNKHSLIEGYCLNLRQYSRKRPEGSIFFDHKNTRRTQKAQNVSGRLIRRSEIRRQRVETGRPREPSKNYRRNGRPMSDELQFVAVG